jgi:hypothetical protein
VPVTSLATPLIGDSTGIPTDRHHAGIRCRGRTWSVSWEQTSQHLAYGSAHLRASHSGSHPVKVFLILFLAEEPQIADFKIAEELTVVIFLTCLWVKQPFPGLLLDG